MSSIPVGDSKNILFPIRLCKIYLMLLSGIKSSSARVAICSVGFCGGRKTGESEGNLRRGTDHSQT